MSDTPDTPAPNPPLATPADVYPGTMASALMRRIGTLNGTSLYYAAHGRFDRPGIWWWSGKENIWLCGTPKELFKVANDMNMPFTLWESSTSTGPVVDELYERAMASQKGHVYEEAPDSRQQPSQAQSQDSNQSSTPPVPLTRFRPQYRALAPSEIALHNEIKAKADELLALYGKISSVRVAARPDKVLPISMQAVYSDGYRETGVPDDSPARNIDFATTHLEDSVMRAIRALTG